MPIARAVRALSLLLVFACPVASLATESGVDALFELSHPDAGPFPSNRYTQIDLRNLTNLQVDLPKPDCAVRVTDCQDVDVLNTLDGFNLQPRLRIPFSGPIDPASVDSSSVFLVRLGDTTRLGRASRETVGVNQIVWDPASNTLFAESDELLEQHTTYALIVTDGVRDARGRRVGGRDFRRFLLDFSFLRRGDVGELLYRLSLADAIANSSVSPSRIVAVSVFTTQSSTAVLEKIRRQIKSATPAAAEFALAVDGSRAVFPRSTLAALALVQQTGTAPTFQTTTVPFTVLDLIPGTVGTVAFGRYRSPDYLTSDRIFPAIGTRSGVPAAQRTNDVFFDLYLPAGAKPANGWPIAIFGHGFGNNKELPGILLASSLASRGIATMSINVVGHGGGPLGRLVLARTGGAPSVTLPSGGRGIDQNGDGLIDTTEGVSAVVPQGIINSRDGLRQTVVDIMQLVRVIETGGVDVDGDGAYDLDPDRIYYAGHSFGGIYGTMLLAVEPSIRAGVPVVPGGANIEVARLGVFRPLVGLSLLGRTPSLINAGPIAPPLFGFNENIPFRNQPAVVNNVAGAIAIQDFFERSEWVTQSGNPVSYAPHLRKAPLEGLEPKPVIVQIAKGDGVVPNPTNTALIRAGDLADLTTYYRNDLAFAANPAVAKDPHGFIFSLTPAGAPFALAAQQQIAVFFASNGATIIDPDGPRPIFETPIVLPLPEELNLIP